MVHLSFMTKGFNEPNQKKTRVDGNDTNKISKHYLNLSKQYKDKIKPKVGVVPLKTK